MEADFDEENDRRRKMGTLFLAFFMATSLLALSVFLREPLPYKDEGGLDFNRLLQPDMNPRRFHNIFRMERRTFLALVDRLRPHMQRDERYSHLRRELAPLLFILHTRCRNLVSRSSSRGLEAISPKPSMKLFPPSLPS